LDADLKKALKQSKWNIESYKIAVDTYRNAESKEQKKDMERLIADIKGNFRSEIGINDPKKLSLEKKKGELFNYTQQVGLFERSKKEQTQWNKTVNTLSAEVQKLETDIEEIKSNKIYENAFEWRFEFPEVLNDAGDFVGFDVVIGNPPYGAKLNNEEKNLFLNKFINQDYQLDTYLLFNEQAINLLSQNGEFSFIIPNTWLTNIKFKKIRNYIVNNTYIHEITHYNKAVFEEAVVDTETLFFKKTKKANSKININIFENINDINRLESSQLDWINLDGDTINITISKEELNLKNNIESNNSTLGIVTNVVSGMNPYEVGKGNPKQTREDVKNRIYDAKVKENEFYKKVLRGSDINKYKLDWKSEVWIKYGDNLAAPRYSANFEFDEKIVVRQTSDTLIATLDINKFICLKNLHVITSIENSKFDLKYILSLINSKLLDFYHYLLNPEKGEALAEIKKINLEKLPIKLISKEFQQPFIEKVDQILALKQENPQADTSVLEREIDELVYALYGLSEEEIGIVEGK
jgi:predicted RNA methylase